MKDKGWRSAMARPILHLPYLLVQISSSNKPNTSGSHVGVNHPEWYKTLVITKSSGVAHVDISIMCLTKVRSQYATDLVINMKKYSSLGDLDLQTACLKVTLNNLINVVIVKLYVCVSLCVCFQWNTAQWESTVRHLGTFTYCLLVGLL